MLTKTDGALPTTMQVTFRLPASIWATSVSLVGAFHSSDLRDFPMHRSVPGEYWQVTIELLRGRSYEYRYLIDGRHWCSDSNADDCVANVRGGDKSVVKT